MRNVGSIIQSRFSWRSRENYYFCLVFSSSQIYIRSIFNCLSINSRQQLDTLYVIFKWIAEKLRVKIKITIVVYVCKVIIRLNFNKCIRWSVVSHKRHFRLERISVQMEKSYYLLQSLRYFRNRWVTQVYSFEFTINILHGAEVYRVPRVPRIGVIVSDSTNDVEPER